MKVLIRLMILPGFFLLSTTSQAAESKAVVKTKAHKCAVFKQHAKKARHLYSVNRKKAKRLNTQMQVLKKDQKRMPSSVKLAKTVVKHKIQRLSVGKKKRLATSLKYLEKHIKFAKAAKRTCARHKHKVKPKFKKQNVEKYLSIANQ